MTVGAAAATTVSLVVLVVCLGGFLLTGAVGFVYVFVAVLGAITFALLACFIWLIWREALSNRRSS